MTITVDGPSADLLAITTVVIDGEADLLRVRSTIRAYAHEAGLGLTATTKLVTAGSELARNILRYATGGQGVASIERAASGQRRGVGPCLPTAARVSLISTWRCAPASARRAALGWGCLAAARQRRFFIDSAPGRGTKVAICQWAC